MQNNLVRAKNEAPPNGRGLWHLFEATKFDFTHLYIQAVTTILCAVTAPKTPRGIAVFSICDKRQMSIIPI